DLRALGLGVQDLIKVVLEKVIDLAVVGGGHWPGPDRPAPEPGGAFLIGAFIKIRPTDQGWGTFIDVTNPLLRIGPLPPIHNEILSVLVSLAGLSPRETVGTDREVFLATARPGMPSPQASSIEAGFAPAIAFAKPLPAAEFVPLFE